MVTEVITFDRVLQWQETELSYSRVRPITCNVDTMERFYRNREPFMLSQDNRLLSIVRGWLEFAYGFRPAHGAHQRLTRRSPSAGALYPTELLVTLNNGPERTTLYYHFSSHRFYCIDEKPMGFFDVEFTELVVEIHVASIFWRTVQRYGVRGYRYCLLDAANVVDNLVYIVRGAMPESDVIYQPVSSGRFAPVCLNHGEGYLGTIRISNIDTVSPENVSVETGYMVPGDIGEAFESPPSLSPELRRVHWLHDFVSNCRYRSWATDVIESRQDAAEIIDMRYSSRDFTADAMSEEAVDDIRNALYEEIDAWIPCGVPMNFHLIHLKQDAGSIRVKEYKTRNGNMVMETILSATTFAGVCQGQEIVRQATLAILVSAEEMTKEARNNQDFYDAVFCAGQKSAMLHRLAVELKIGTTIIGGFSDGLMREVLGIEGELPIMVQLFGVSSACGRKVDAVPVIGLKNHERRIQ